MKTKTFWAFVLASVLGTLFHFVYDWTGKAMIIGFFFPVNESIWEHLKLIFFPIMLVAIPEYYFLGDKNPAFLCIKLKSALLGMAATTVLFYTYFGIWGENVDWVNIAIYYISMALAYGYSYRELKKENLKSSPTLCLFLIFLIMGLFMIFSVNPPDIGLFWEP